MVGLGYKIDYELIKKILISIEPSDSTFLPGLNIFNHKKGRIYKKFDKLPELDILIFLEQGSIDTIQFNQRTTLKNYNKKKENLVKKALTQVGKGLELKNKKLLGQGVNYSSKAHQDIISRPYLDFLIDKIDGYKGAYGINIAHSGKLMGVFVEPEQTFSNLIEEIESVGELDFFQRVKLISGGIELLE